MSNIEPVRFCQSFGAGEQLVDCFPNVWVLIVQAEDIVDPDDAFRGEAIKVLSPSTPQSENLKHKNLQPRNPKT